MSTLGTRIKLIRGNENQNQFAAKLGIPQTTLSRYERDASAPDIDFLVKLSDMFDVCIEWLVTGRGVIHTSDSLSLDKFTELRQRTDRIIAKRDDIIMIPMVEAVLSAGGGSFETSSITGRDYAFRRDFIERKGNPDDMVLMRVSGDSMEPDVLNGDVVLIDQGKTRIVPGLMFAVGFEESIYLKRIDNLPGKVVLKSANPAYPPLELDVRGDLAEQFRVIGRVLWSGREYK